MGKNPLGISVNIGNYTLMADYARAGFKVVEISLPYKPFEERRAFAQAAFDALKAASLTLWSVHLPFARDLDISALDEGKRAAAIKELTRDIEVARSLGAQTLIIHGSSEPNPDNERADRLLACAKSLDELQAIAHGMALAVENLPRTCIGRTGEEMAMLGQHCAGVCFDVNHLLCENHEAFMSHAVKQVITTHLSDYDAVNERHWLPGMGIVPWKQVHDSLLAVDYAGPFLFELGDDPATKQPYAPDSIIPAWEKVIAR
jgi:sugar phosphate isomerase/epimerase